MTDCIFSQFTPRFFKLYYFVCIYLEIELPSRQTHVNLRQLHFYHNIWSGCLYFNLTLQITHVSTQSNTHMDTTAGPAVFTCISQAGTNFFISGNKKNMWKSRKTLHTSTSWIFRRWFLKKIATTSPCRSANTGGQPFIPTTKRSEQNAGAFCSQRVICFRPLITC